jgi:hypothetical protein
LVDHYYECGYHRLTNFNIIATICESDARNSSQTGRIQHDDHHLPHPAAYSFSHSRGSRVRRVPPTPACKETGRTPPDSRQPRIQEFDALRRRPDTLSRITRPPYGLPVRGRGTRDCRLPLPSTRSVHSVMRVRGARLAADWSPFVSRLRRTDSVRAERMEVASQ